MRAPIATVASLLALAAPAGAAELPPGSAPYGLVVVNANFVPGDTVAERSANYRRLYRAGVRAIRLDINWVQVEPVGGELGQFDFRERDREVTAIRRAGLKVIGLLAYGHPDYSARGRFLGGTPAGGGVPPFYVLNAQYFPPDDPDDFARYARATAAHYGTEVVAWEVWNEQNEGWRFWPPHEDPPAYARLLCTTYRALKRVDPETPVVYGGVFFPALPGGVPGMSGPDFVEATYDANPRLGRCYDALGYHPYPYPFTAPELDVPIRGSVLAAADAMRAVVERHGDGRKPLWITEVGWPTHDRAYGVPEEKQAQYIARMYAASFAQRLPVVTWYTYGDYEDPTGANQEAWFGLFRPDNSPKPAHNALRTFARVLRGATFRTDRSRSLGLPPGALLSGGRGFALEYRSDEAVITALWLAGESASEGQNRASSGDDETLTVELPVRSPSVRVVDYLGRERSAAASRGRVALTLGPGPVYVVDPIPGASRRARIRLRVRYRGGRCALGGVRASVTSGAAIRRVVFYAGRVRAGRDARAPFKRRIPARLLPRGRSTRIKARISLRDGRRATRSRRVRACRSPSPRYTG